MAAVLIFENLYWFWSFSPVNHSWQKCCHGNKKRSISNFWISEFSKYIVGKSDQISIQSLRPFRYSIQKPEWGGIRPPPPVRLGLIRERNSENCLDLIFVPSPCEKVAIARGHSFVKNTGEGAGSIVWGLGFWLGKYILGFFKNIDLDNS